MSTLAAQQLEPGQVLAKATTRASVPLGLSGAALGRISGVSEPTVSRLTRGQRGLDPQSKEGQLSLLQEWMHGADYSQTHALAEAARNKGVQWICHESVRAEGIRCEAVLDVEAVDMVSSDSQHQTWQCKTNRSSVMMQHGSECFVWNF